MNDLVKCPSCHEMLSDFDWQTHKCDQDQLVYVIAQETNSMYENSMQTMTADQGKRLLMARWILDHKDIEDQLKQSEEGHKADISTWYDELKRLREENATNKRERDAFEYMLNLKKEELKEAFEIQDKLFDDLKSEAMAHGNTFLECTKAKAMALELMEVIENAHINLVMEWNEYGFVETSKKYLEKAIKKYSKDYKI